MANRGEIRFYAGGHYEMHPMGNILFPVWITGTLVYKRRYSNKYDRRKAVRTIMKTWQNVEVVILPDDIKESKENDKGATKRQRADGTA